MSENKITIVDTLHKNKRKIPSNFMSTKGKKYTQLNLVSITKKFTFVSYIPKKNLIKLF